VSGAYDRLVAENGKRGATYKIDRVAARIAAAVSVGRDGGTFNTNAGECTLSEGYFFGGVVPSLRILPENSAKAATYAEVFYPLRDWLSANVDIFTTQHAVNGGSFVVDSYRIGFWVNDSEGAIYFDFVQWTLDLTTALDRAKVRGELAIYDIRAQADIDVADPRNPATGLHYYGSSQWDAEDEYGIMDDEERMYHYGT
jgi:hypothetical protein